MGSELVSQGVGRGGSINKVLCSVKKLQDISKTQNLDYKLEREVMGLWKN